MSVIKASALGLGSAKLLGKGEFAKVFKAHLDGQAVAVKQASPSPHAKRALRRELEALQQLAHPNIVQLLAATDDGRCLVLELCKGGTLEERLADIRGKRSNSRGKSRRQAMPVRRIVQIALELMLGIGAMHEAGLCHGDVKSANILLAKTAVSAQAAGVKLTDMGFVRRIGAPISEEDGGSVPFIPRELQLALETVARPSQDIFACGVAILDILCTGKPYEDLSIREFEEALEEGTLYARGTVPLAEFRNTEAAETLVCLVFEMVSHDPEARPTAAEAAARLEELAVALDGSKDAARTSRRSKFPSNTDSSGTLSGTSGNAESSGILAGASGSADPLSPLFCCFEAALLSEDCAATVTASTLSFIDKCASVDGTMSEMPADKDAMHVHEHVPESNTEAELGPPAEAPALEVAVLAPLAFIDGVPSEKHAGEDLTLVDEHAPESDTEAELGPPVEALALEVPVLAPSAFIDGVSSEKHAGEDLTLVDEHAPESDTQTELGPAVETPALEVAALAPSAFAESPVAQGSGHLLDSEVHTPPAQPSMERPLSPPTAHAPPARAVSEPLPWSWPCLTNSCCCLWPVRWAGRRAHGSTSDAPTDWASPSDGMSARRAISEVLYVSPHLEDVGWKREASPAAVKQGEADQ